MAQTDFLTGCLSKETIDGTLAKVKAECDIDKRPFTMLIIDLDHFKTYNDKYGHLDGDDILKYFASTLRISLKEVENFTFRFGGDEFIIVFPGKGGNEILSIARNIMKIFRRRPFLSRGRIYNLSFSGGIASYPFDGHDTEIIIQKADKAMYFSKTHGRARTTLYRLILWEHIQRWLLILATILVVAGVWLYFKNSSYKDYVVNWAKVKTMEIRTALGTHAQPQVSDQNIVPPEPAPEIPQPKPVPPPKPYIQEPDLVYLKSGRVLSGEIVRDNKDEIEISLSFETGKGTITIKKTDIASIKKQPREVPKERSPAENLPE